MQEFNYSGDWALKEKPRAKTSGILTFNHEEGLKLEILGDGWAKVIHDIWGVPREGPWKSVPFEITSEMISGQTQQGIVYLFDCVGRQTSRFGGRSVSPQFGLIAKAPINFLSKPKFKSLELEFSFLDQFMDITGIVVSPDPHTYGKTQFTTEFPTAHSIKVGQYSISFVWRLSHQLVEGSKHKFQLHEVPGIRVEFEVAADFDEIIGVIHEVRRFLSFTTGQAVEAEKITGYLSLNKVQISGITDQTDKAASIYWSHVELIYNQTRGDKGAKSKNVQICTFTSVQSTIEHNLRKWFEFSKKLEPTITLYLTHAYRPRMYAEIEFLSIAQALEAYHRRIYGGHYGKKEEYQQIKTEIKRLVKGLSDERLKEQIKSSLGYANQFIFSDRLHDLFARLPQQLNSQLDAFFPDRSHFIKQVKETRNYYTHYEEKKDDEELVARDNLHLHGLTQKSKLLLHLSVLVILEVPIEVIERVLDSHPLKYVAQERFGY